MRVADNTTLVADILTRTILSEDDCWMFLGPNNGRGYGKINQGGESFYAHRVICQEFHGLPDGWIVDHLCHNADTACPGGPGCRHRRCVNPDHLEPIPSHKENLQRAREGRPEPASCANGHPWPENLIMRYGNRVCVVCERLRGERARRKAGKRKRDPNFCFKGHPRTPENTRMRSDGWRDCIPCQREAMDRYVERQKSKGQ